MSRGLIVFLVAIAIGFFGLVVYKIGASQQKSTSPGSSNVYGKSDSPVQLTEYVDFQCEACYAFYPTVKTIKEKYKDKVKFQIKYFPITSSHQYAKMGAAYAESAARQGKFFEMHDKIFENQKKWETASKPQEYFDSYAKALGLDMAKLTADVESREVADIINTDVTEVRALGGSGTPTFTLNGKKIENPKNDVESFSKLLDEALAEKK